MVACRDRVVVPASSKGNFSGSVEDLQRQLKSELGVALANNLAGTIDSFQFVDWVYEQMVEHM